jgi:hypothetical protein
LHDGDNTLGRLGVTKAACDSVVDEDDRHVTTRGGSEQIGLTVCGSRRDEEFTDDVRRRVDDFGDGVRSFDQKRASGRPLPASQELSGGRNT